MKRYIRHWDRFAQILQKIDFFGPLALRLYLVPIFWIAGIEKLYHMEDTIAWFGNAEWGLGFPYPTVLAYLATLIEIAGAVCLLFGFVTRLMTISLSIIILVAIFAVHFNNAWLVMASQGVEVSQHTNTVMMWFQKVHPILYAGVAANGTSVMLSNGMEFAYLLMLIVILLFGPGRYVSVDYWLRTWFHDRARGGI